ncbi:MAG: hypothetical protein WC773_03630 [Patescibacteria group bacterium]|jgi:hypothetical protein
MQKVITYILICLTMVPSIALAQLGQARAEGGIGDTIVTSGEIDTGDGEDDITQDFTPSLSANYIANIYSNLSDMQSRRPNFSNNNQTLPKIGMSQCDQQLVRSGQIDQRVLQSLNYLVTPVSNGGAGMTYLYVTFGKSCAEENSPDSIGTAYPVIFDGETADPNNPGYPLLKTAPSSQPSASASPSNSSAAIKIYKSISGVIAPLTEAASVNTSAQTEPNGVSTVHKKGQAADITAAGLVMCTTKSGGVMGIGAKITRQAPRPVKVAWQTDAGVANVQTPFGNTYDSMSTTAGLDQFLAGFESSDGTFQAQALKGAFTMMGYNLLANQMGIKPSTFDPNTAALDYRTLGYAALADLMDLPNSAVFNPYINASDTTANPLNTSQNNVETLLSNSLLRSVEKNLNLSAGSLNGNSVEEVMTNAGQRYLEKSLGLQNQSLRGSLDSPQNVLLSIGQAKLETYYHLPTGAGDVSNSANSAINTIINNITGKLGLTGSSSSYASSLIKGALNIPTSVSVGDLTNKNSSFWNSAQGQKYKANLSNFDQQLFPDMSNTENKSVFSDGYISYIDQIKNTDRNDMTYRFVVGDLSLPDYEAALGYGSILNQYGAYQSTTTAYDLPMDQPSYYTTSDGTNVRIESSIFGGTTPVPPSATLHKYPQNQFLSELIKGNKNYWVALGVDAVAKSLQMSSDKIFSQSYKDNAVLSNTGMVFDAINGKRTFNFSAANASLTSNLSPNQFLSVVGSFLAPTSSSKNYQTAATQRQNTIRQVAESQMNYTFSNIATKAIGDQNLANLLYQYDRSRPSTSETIESFPVSDASALTYHLSNKAVKVSSVTVTDREGAPLSPSSYSVSADGTTVTLPSNQYNNLGSNTVTIKYTALATKASNPSEITPNLVYSLLNNPTALNSIALQYGAMKVSTALNLPPTALSFAANLLGANGNSGVGGVGQSALENIAGLLTGSLNSDNWQSALTQSQAQQIFRLQSVDYTKIVNKDSGYLTSIAPQLGSTDDYYHIDYGSTKDLFDGKITFADYKKRIGNAQLRYNAGSVLASQFDVKVAGYRLSGQDFYDLIDGSYYNVLNRIGQRITEKNHGLPVGALATSLLTGTDNISLYALGTNVVASVFHLNTIDLSHANSIAGVQSAIGQSTIEQALGFGASSFYGNTVLDVAKKTGAESFASAYGIILPSTVQAQLNAVSFSYSTNAMKSQRDQIVYNYLTSTIGPSVGAEGHFSDVTLKRFDIIDQSLGIESGSTLKMMQGGISPDDYVQATSKKAVTDGIAGELASILGIPDKYSILGKDVISALANGENMKAFQDLVGGFGGTYVDAQVGWDRGTFSHLLANMNNVTELKRTLIYQGALKLSQITGISTVSLQMMFRGNYTNALSEEAAKIVNVNGFTSVDAANLFNGHFTIGMTYIGAAMMANTADMKEAGITYADIRNSIIGDPIAQQDYINAQLATAHPELAAAGGDIALLYMSDVESLNRQFMNNARQNLSYKYMDYQARKLLPDDVAKFIQPGFAKALIGGQYTYVDITGKTISLTGDAARWRYAKDFMVSYAVNNIPILKDMGIPADTLGILTDYVTSHSGDDAWLETQLTARDAGGRTGIDKLGTSFDRLTNKVFNIDLAPGTGSALVGYAFSGDTAKLQANLWTSWQGAAFNWADKTLGMQSGTTMTIYQGITQYQTALATYQNASMQAMQSLSDASTMGTEAFNEALDNASSNMNSASRQFKTQTSMIIAAVANVIFQKQIGQVESVLGLQSGTLIYLIQYLIHPDPISLGLFIFFNFIWGKTTVTCAIDYYPLSGSADANQANASLAALKTALNSQTTETANITASSSLDSQLKLPNQFSGTSNDSYRKGIKAGAQYEVRRVIGSLLLMKDRTRNTNLKPNQIGTYDTNDLNLFETISTSLYGNLTTRPAKIGPGWFDKTTDRVHLGF